MKEGLIKRLEKIKNASVQNDCVSFPCVSQPVITVVRYDSNNYCEEVASEVNQCLIKPRRGVTWVDVEGFGNTEAIALIGEHYGIHHLLLEDIVSTSQRPKLDNFGDHLFIVLKQISFSGNSLTVDHLSIVIGKNFVVTFQEKPDTIFDQVKKRLQANTKQIRSHGPDYLAYCLIDAVVDDYFVTVEKFEDKIDDLEDLLVQDPKPEVAQTIRKLRRDIIFLRKAVWPLREVLISFDRQDTKLIKKQTLTYMRDVYDHIVQINDVVEIFRELLSGMLDLYLSSLSNRMNEVMKTLTIIATIFIPLTFVAGVYGMNFKYMPEIDAVWGYPGVWAVMISMTAGMLYYFRRKNWI
jgi:magnesium transporter